MSKPSNEVQKIHPRLPVELLRNVFEEYLRMDLPVQALLGACREWRSVALKTKSLWRRLLLSADATPTSLRTGHAHNSDGQASLPLKRSWVSSQLKVNLVLDPQNEEMSILEQRPSLFRTVNPSALEPISFLCVIVNPGMTLPSSSGACNGKLAQLESLMIASAQPSITLCEPLQALMDLIDDSSTRLKSLYLENVSKDFIVEASNKEYWMNLVRITISNAFDSLDAVVFARAPNLEFLSFSGWLIESPQSTTASPDSSQNEPIEFPELKWFRVYMISMNTLSHFRLPKLHTMAIDNVGAYPSPDLSRGELVMPSLKVLQISTLYPTIACINAPELDTLCLSIPALKQPDADHVLKSVFHGGEGMMQPRHLTFRGPVHDKHLIAAFHLLGDRLVSVELDCQMSFSKTFWMEMTPGASPRCAFKCMAPRVASTAAGAGDVPTSGGKSKIPLLPNLRCLVVDVHKNPMAAGEGRDMRALISKFIEARAPVGGLLRLACKWRKVGGPEEMIDPPSCPHCVDTDTRSV